MADLANPRHIRFMILYCDTIHCDEKFALPNRYIQRLSKTYQYLLRDNLTTRHARVGINWEEGPKIVFEVLDRRDLHTTQLQVQQLTQCGFFQTNDIEVVPFNSLR